MRLRPILICLTCLAMIAYFTYHLVSGGHGLEARSELYARVIALRGELAGLRAVRRHIERDVDLMRAGRLDPDMLDERARAILNFAHPNDIVIFDGKTSATGAIPRR